MSFHKTVWETLGAIDCSANVTQKGRFNYLSWTWAWSMLMKEYPESSYEFKDTVIDSVGSVEVWCSLTVKEGEKSVEHSMWLPVMDNKNNSIINPTSRQVSDARMRCLVKCIAMFGLGLYIYAGEDLPDPEVAAAAEQAKYDAFCEPLTASIDAIKEGISSNDLSAASEAWQELSEEEKTVLWRAPSKGGVFSTEEREVMKTTEFRTANQ